MFADKTAALARLLAKGAEIAKRHGCAELEAQDAAGAHRVAQAAHRAAQAPAPAPAVPQVDQDRAPAEVAERHERAAGGLDRTEACDSPPGVRADEPAAGPQDPDPDGPPHAVPTCLLGMVSSRRVCDRAAGVGPSAIRTTSSARAVARAPPC